MFSGTGRDEVHVLIPDAVIIYNLNTKKWSENIILFEGEQTDYLKFDLYYFPKCFYFQKKTTER